MTDKRWNDDIADVFYIHRVFLKVYGLWPLQTQTVFTKIRWSLCMTAQFTILPFVMMDLWSNQNTNSNIECIAFFTGSVLGIAKCLCITANQNKLSMNINAVIDDWISVKNNKEKKIMKKSAAKAKVLTSILLFSLIISFSFYISGIVFMNRKQIFFMDDSVNVNTSNWVFMIPSGPLSSSITGSQFAIILTIQIIQISIMAFMIYMADTFIFNITIHLTGQLELLKNTFKTFANNMDSELNYQKKFVNLINRFNELTELHQNLEDSFNFLILFQLVITTVLLVSIGLLLEIRLNEQNYIESVTFALGLAFLLTQSLIPCYSSEYLQEESEGIFYALYETSWFTLPLALKKDLHFAMMRSRIPFRFTGGKCFSVNCETMKHILKTAISYISILRIVLKK